MLDNTAAVRTYFAALAECSRTLLNRLPIAANIEPIAETFGRLKPALELARPAELGRLQALARVMPVRSDTHLPAGMNTIGILADRLTILVCKEWYLRHRQHRPADADEVYHVQLAEVVTALAHAGPGQKKLLEKVSSLSAEVTGHSFEEAYYGLLSANILMWETQEMLYTRDMAQVPPEELRDYIRFFSQANMLRNRYIVMCEELYWQWSN